MNHIINFLHLVVAIVMVALVIAYAAVIIPIALTCVVGFILLLWLLSNTVNSISYLGHWLRERRSRKSR